MSGATPNILVSPAPDGNFEIGMVIATHNRPYYLWKTLRCLQKTFHSREVVLVVVDDAQPVPRFRFNYFKLPAFVESCRLSGMWALSLWKSGVSSYEVANRKLFKLIPSYGNWGSMGYVVGPETS